MEVYVFSRKRVEAENLDDGYGGEVSLARHMRYVLEECGTPDCIDILRGSFTEIAKQMKKWEGEVFVDEYGDEIEA